MLDFEKNKIFISGVNKLTEWDRPKERLNILLKNYLELDNVSFLFGAGSSIVLGSVSIANIPHQIEGRIKESVETDEQDENSIYDEFLKIISSLQERELASDDGQPELPIRNDKDEIQYSLEALLNYLSAIKFIQLQTPEAIQFKYIDDLLRLIKSELFILCDIDKRQPKPSPGFEEILERNKYHYHEMFIKKILQRPLNLRRANLFTTNYDVAFEYSFDKLGVQYIDGFSGFNRRTLRPEIFDHDIFFPGSTTQGKVHRIERVVKYFKLHGSLTWVSEPPSSSNIYGISEYPIDYIRNIIKEDIETAGKLMIYPTTEKKTHTLDFPYSELFRQFSNVISQPQSVLITFGYSFRDEHINDIIHQALAIPSFTLVIIDYYGTDETNGSDEIKRLKNLNDPRIIILEGEQLGDLSYFTQHILPDIIESKEEEKIATTLKSLYEDKGKEASSGSVEIEDEQPETDQLQDFDEFDDMEDDLPY